MKIEEVNARILEMLSGKEKEDFESGLKALNITDPADRIALRESVKRLMPDFSEAQIDIFIEGKAKSETDSWIA